MIDYESNWETAAVKKITQDTDEEAFECPDCGEIEMRQTGRIVVELGLRTDEIFEYECDACNAYITLEGQA